MGLMLKGSYAEDGACHLHGAKKDAPASDQQRMRRETKGLSELSLHFPAQRGHCPPLSVQAATEFVLKATGSLPNLLAKRAVT